jgi:hypothetical protein
MVVNADFETALSELKSIVCGQGEPLRADRPALKTLVAALLAS